MIIKLQYRVYLLKFYINYVICKSIKINNLNSKNFMFYINYVICKFYWWGKRGITNESFILTTWYVNDKLIEYLTKSSYGFILTTWYVNYYTLESHCILIYCFILTTWYVNSWGGYWCWNDDKSFILTTWYVNVI